ncbi:transporter substrate-binding domain-containing protein [Colwellia sp. MB3u-70]|nr:MULTISPECIES: transporter substrate-binding domain-containing protein [unclassified Colwellia]MBA6291024.1 transporter substrate-binding domain-containing protein [Colwellia sp. MB3u-8]MBA6308257.1 transporter substrate-binding domain-containing protein [Colwellia sp. MB3u-70]
MKSNSRLLFLVLSCCWFLCATAFSRSYDDIIEKNEIIVAVYRDFQPFSYLENGEEKGIDIDLAHAIAKKLGVKLKLRWMTADETVDDDLRNNLWKGHFLNRTVADLMLRVPYDRDYSLLRDDIGELVHQHVHMFAPFHTESWKVIFNSKKIESVETIAVFQYHDVGVEVDSIPQFYLTSAFQGRMRDRAKQFPTISEAISAMTESKVDAVMGLTSQISHYQSELSKTNYPLAKNAFPMMGQQQWDIGMAVKNDYRQLGYMVADIVESMINTGEIEKIFAKYHVIYKIPNLYKAAE